MKQFDVIIAGGAMAGATLALALDRLSQGQLTIAVVEAYQADSEAHPGFDSRCIALSYGTVQILQRLSLWNSLQKVATAIEHIHVSDRTHAGMTDITHHQLGLDALGYVVELADVGLIYAQQIAQCSNIELFCPQSVLQVERSEKSVVVTLSDGQSIAAKLLVAADGAISTCCEQVGVALREHDFEQVAVIANVLTQQPHQGRAFERFTADGPVALLPMSDNRLSLVWCLPPEKAQQILSLSDDAFLLQLQQAFGWRLGKMNKVGARASYPLILRYREQNISHRFAIVGNAAQTLHPIAGQGFNLGIRDVVSLADELVKQLSDVGEYRGLHAFKQRREQDRLATITLTSSLVHLFSNDWLATRIGRNVGLAMMDNLPWLKMPLLRRTLGVVNR
ncbi:2-octaprenyl-6-methoxyphenyl hydroxylase [Vibrio aestuarianus]|uniref:2-octaprenyl-6-methoxyphenyl hydroxylase n=1 Tax=Vibrio aestuarianus TaxID=28171 RepID=A0A9X4IYJ6_9VIBR|nr:2-octaprenyl-6-methoxyphenyl hydroxylase [Vibrio aestuarianus]MDE1235242.1 2-octaprenyl-6-methoxyphenyl hydroxylase [Vibrio aestuarianus]MDE1246068.1 2-octaprenyl-6-methoxyphenyl hydroxylase [Vibrio aestuarianus]MDE1344971.1 2-octaprenyl-6-methoxyphenyl hydroxylase [Vibrio aestuarianus]NGZ61577.1 2-octaprenyl-6-methoxyphenyl hydroxylase [Vibrio aestuarianus subsp. cardii]NGZ65953.1 2-octaprenyl-6-methoxyphenyl hydroxylase [Vibrio aestuarianus subsp. cardii]